jgi:hypothetical protein
VTKIKVKLTCLSYEQSEVAKQKFSINKTDIQNSEINHISQLVQLTILA